MRLVQARGVTDAAAAHSNGEERPLLRPIRLLVALVVLACVAIAPAATTAASDPAAQMRKIITVKGMLKHENALQQIADQNGGVRTAGTPGFDASVNYVVKKSGRWLQARRAAVRLRVLLRELACHVRTHLAESAHVRGPGEFRHDGLLGERRRHGRRQGGSRQPVPAGPTASSSNAGCEDTDFAVISPARLP